MSRSRRFGAVDMPPPATSGTLDALKDALESLTSVADALDDTQEQSRLNTYELNGRAQVEELPVDQLLALAANGHLVELRIRSATWSTFVRLGGREGAIFETDGPIHVAVEAAAVADLERAITRRDLSTSLRLLEGNSAALTVKLVNRPSDSGTHWIRSADRLKVLVSEEWLPTATELAQGPSQLLVDDLNDVVILTEGLAITGISDRVSTEPARTPAADSAPSDQSFVLRRSEPIAYPSPLRFAGSRLTAGTPSQPSAVVVEAMDILASMLVWALVANSATPSANGLEVRISGVREVTARIAPNDAEAAQDLTKLYRWVALSPETDRLDFVQQALALAVVNDSDMTTAASPALRTAKSLYELSRRGSVAEAMAARRAARDAALSAARGAANAGREAAGKTVERTVIQVVAAAGVLIAQVKSALSTTQAVVLLLLIGGLCAGLLTVTLRVTLESARAGLDEELRDLDQYRDSLSQDDINAIRGSGTITSARNALSRARLSTWWAYGGSIVLAVTAALVLGISSSAGADEAPPTTPSYAPSGTSPHPSPTTPAPHLLPDGETAARHG